MTLLCHTINEECFLQSCEDATPKGAWLQETETRWLDIEATSHSDLKDLLAPLQIDEEVFGFLEIEESSHFALFEIAGNAHYCRVPLPVSDNREARYLVLICLPHTLISVHDAPSSSLAQIRAESCEKRPLIAPTVHGLVYQILLRFSDADVATYFELRRTVECLVGSIDESPDEFEMDSILTMQRQVSSLLNSCEDQINVQANFWELERAAGGLLEENFRISAYEGQERFRSVLTRMEQRLEDLHQHYQMTLQETTNNRLRFLTILSAVFLPMTFIAGVYGMNFKEMPELDQPYAYFIALLTMTMIGGGMMAFFYFKGWFK